MEDWKYGRMEVLKHFTANCQQKNPPGKPRGKVKQVAMVYVLGVTGLTDGI
jgi:hypothetical protein